MKLKQWLIGAAGALALGLLAVPADAAPFSGATDGVATGNAAVHKAFGWWGHWGHRHHHHHYRPCAHHYGGCGHHYYRPYAYYSYTPYYYRPYAYPGYFYYAPRRHRHHHHRRWHRW